MIPSLDILVVEDSPTQTAILSDLLEKSGFRVTTACHGRDALTILQTLRPHMILSDILMPEMDGFQLCRHIKSDPSLRDIPVTMLTSLSDPLDVIMALSVGADYFLTKPVLEDRLADQIRSFISSRSQRSNQTPDDSLQISWKGITYPVTASRQQIVDLLLSTYENATIQNRELERVNRELVFLKQQLEEDIQKRKQVENRLMESEQHLQLVLDSIRIGVIIVNPRSGKVVDANRYALELVDLKKPDIVGLLWTDLLKEEGIGLLAPRASDQPGETERYLKCRNGKSIPILTHATPIRFQGEILSLETFVDITDQMRAREEILNAKAAAENASNSKSEFLANTSHELRTPMNGIIGMASLLMDTPLSEEQKEFVRTIRDSAKSLLRIMNDILDFSKMEAGKLELDIIDFDLRITLDEVISLLRTKAMGKGLRLEIWIHHEVPSLVSGDPGRLRQILMNLVGNAIKFTPDGSVRIEVTPEPENGGMPCIRFSVIDTGIGIPAEKQHRLFQGFSQVDASTARKFGGTGLGLAISKRFVEMMGGKIGMTSRPEKGSIFWFSIPLQEQSEPESKPLPAPADLRGKRILIVDEVDINRKTLAGLLHKQQCVVEDAANSLEAVRKLQEFRKKKTPFDAAVIDMQMPGIDGKALGRAIKTDPDLTDTVLVLVTGSGIRGDAQWLQDIGFSAYLTQPIQKDQLITCLATALGIPLTIVKKPANAIVTRFSLSEEKKRKIRILLVEDNPVNQKIALIMLSKFGYRAETAQTGMEALRMMKKIRYDLVLMDVVMPEMDGYETTDRIRDPKSGTRNPDVPVIAMTANAMKGDREKCLAAGMNDYLSKPIDPPTLLEVVERWLPDRHANGSLLPPPPDRCSTGRIR